MKLCAPFWYLFWLLSIAFALPLLGAEEKIQKAVFIDRFLQEEKLYIIVDQGTCFEVVADPWKCDNWLPGDLVKIERLTGYSSFNFSIKNLSVDRTVYANFAYKTLPQKESSDLWQKRIEDLEKRISLLEKLLLEGNY